MFSDRFPLDMKKQGRKNAVIVNEREAEIVRYIFSLAVQGKTSTQIARQLYEENVPTLLRCVIRKRNIQTVRSIHGV